MAQGTSHFVRCRVAAFAVVTLAGFVGCDQYRLAPLQRSVPVPLVRPASPAAQENAIEVALVTRHWAVVRKTPGRYVARLNERVHEVVINIDYDPSGITMTYVDSKQLLYQRDVSGQETIHRKYNTWIKNLAEEIRMALVQPGGGPRPLAPLAPYAPAQTHPVHAPDAGAT
jgi:hypothetical protein